MTTRDDILTRVRAAVTNPKRVDIPRRYRTHGDHPVGHPRLVELLADRLQDYRAVVHHSTEAGIPLAVDAILRTSEDRAGAPRGGHRPQVVVPPGLPRHWLPNMIEAVQDDDLSVERLEAMDGVITTAAVAVAETGTIILDASADQGRRIITLLPDLHVCIVWPTQIVETVPEAIARLEPTRPQTWISGPSATSDIELRRVEGVHGPRNLHVVIVDQTPEGTSP